MTVDPRKVKKGDQMRFIFWAQVDQVVANGDKILVTNMDNGEKFSINGSELVEKGESADVVEDTKRVTMTEAAEILENIPGTTPFTVVFTEQDGTTRTLRGRRLGTTALGRSQVQDLDVPYNKNRFRQVDHRTIQKLIVDNVEYVTTLNTLLRNNGNG